MKRRDLFKGVMALGAALVAAPLAKYLPQPEPRSLKFSKDAFLAVLPPDLSPDWYNEPDIALLAPYLRAGNGALEELRRGMESKDASS